LNPGAESSSPPGTIRSLRTTPNPFNPSTVASFELRVASLVNLKVYDTAGRLIRTLADGRCEAGVHKVAFDGSGLAAGVYFLALRAEGQTQTRKILLVK